MNSFDNKIFIFASALSDVYREEEYKENMDIVPLKLKEESLTEDFTAMIYAQWALYRNITGEEIDIIDFTHICNKLVVQKIMEEKAEQEHVDER